MSERALDYMVHRVKARQAFGKSLAEQGTIQADIAQSRCEARGRIHCLSLTFMSTTLNVCCCCRLAVVVTVTQIDQARLLTYTAAAAMDMYGNKAAKDKVQSAL